MERKINVRRSIGFKFALAILLVSLVVLAVAIASEYFLVRTIMLSVEGKNQKEMARVAASAFKRIITEEIADTKNYLLNSLWVSAAERASAGYEGLSLEAVKDRISELRKRSASAPENGNFSENYFDGKVSLELENAVKMNKDMAEMALTDRFGVIVAASSRVSELYRGDKEWFQKSYNKGKGNDSLGHPEYNETSASRTITIAEPIISLKAGVVGVAKVSLRCDRFFEPVGVLRTGKTGKAVLVSGNNKLIFKLGVEPSEENYLPAKYFKLLTDGAKQFITLKARGPYGAKKVFYTCARVEHELLDRQGFDWWVFIERDAEEVLAPINLFVSGLTLSSLLLILLLVVFGIFAGRYFVAPINKLYDYSERIRAGELDSEVSIRTGDEIEGLAVSFSALVKALNEKQAELIRAKSKLEDWSRSLEKRVEERTADLVKTQEAALNIMEDLQESKNELEEMNDELRRLNSLKSEFISTVSHELRTPLSITKEGINLVLEGILGGITEKQRDVLAASKESMDRLARLINSLLDISKIEAGKIELKRELIEMGDAVKGVVEFFGKKARDKGLELRTNVVGEPKVFADIDRITQVFVNLVGNSVKYTEKGSIEIAVKETPEEVICSVSDTGVGIPADNLGRIFDKFQQFGRVSGPGDRGIGLGLSIAKGIIETHRGRIWAESELGKGSVFYFTIPKHTIEDLFKESVERGIEEVLVRDSSISAIFAFIPDLDRVKEDLSGGDLRKLMDGLKSTLRSCLRRAGDNIIGDGGEMLILLYDCKRDGAFSVKNRLEIAIREFLEKNPTFSKINIKLGFAEYPNEASDAEDLIKKARGRLELLKR